MKVYKIDNKPEQAVYIGRPSKWKNPYKIGKDGNRDEVIEKFRNYALLRLEKEPNWLKPLVGKDLYCYCAPLRCHGDIIIELINIGEK
jgi:hypothetical protein